MRLRDDNVVERSRNVRMTGTRSVAKPKPGARGEKRGIGGVALAVR